MGIVITVILFVVAVMMALFVGAAMATASRADDMSAIEAHYMARLKETTDERNFYMNLCRENHLLDNADWSATETISGDELNKGLETFLNND